VKQTGHQEVSYARHRKATLEVKPRQTERLNELISANMVRPPELEPGSPAWEAEIVNSCELPTSNTTELLSRFKEFCKIDLNHSVRTIHGHWLLVKRFLETIEKDPAQVTSDDLRAYLAQFKTKSPNTYANVLKSLKIFFRDFLRMPNVVESFKFPRRIYAPKIIPDKEDLQRFFKELDSLRDQTTFLLYATSGLRRNESLSLTLDEIDVESRTITARKAHQNSTTKNAWVNFFNFEAQSYVRRYLSNRETDDNRLFPVTEVTIRRGFKQANEKTGLQITPQILRDWFCSQLGELGVPDRYVDAFCGRIPKSVLAKHYTDYSPEKLKRIYDNANLSIGVT